MSDYKNVPGGPEGLVALGKALGLACKWPGCMCESKCLRRDEPFCDTCGAPVSVYGCYDECGCDDE
jgi:hypothetical protein